MGCMRVPIQGQLAARITDGIIERECWRGGGSHPSSFYAMGRYRRRGVDLVVSRPGGRRLGFCFEPWPSPRCSDRAYRALREAIAEGWIHAGILVTCEGSPGIRDGGVVRLPAPLLLVMYSQWTEQAVPREDQRALMEWLVYNPNLLVGAFADPAEPMPLDCWEFLPLEAEWFQESLLHPP